MEEEDRRKQEEFERRSAAIPEKIREATKHCGRHRQEILSSSFCGCFSCLNLFPPSTIDYWTDLDETGTGLTAMCPCCGLDTVIGDKSGFPITQEFMREIKAVVWPSGNQPLPEE
jgi:hypothetical protein